MSGKVGSITTSIIVDGLIFNMDAANRASYPKTGTNVTDTIGNLIGIVSGVSFNTTNEGIFEFDGTDDEIGFGDNLSAPTSLSIFAWINTADNSEFPIVVKGIGAAGNREYSLYILTTKISGIVADESAGDVDNLLGSTTIAENEWLNVGMSWDGSTLRVYLNGEIDGSVATSVTEIENLSAPLYIGRDMSPDFANGKIANAQIYNRALSSSEVLHNYNALKNRFI